MCKHATHGTAPDAEKIAMVQPLEYAGPNNTNDRLFENRIIDGKDRSFWVTLFQEGSM
ncbi:hypothetical protein [Komagataeibacter sp. FXV3]|uniref:hypothetical protein n=1 Tax=Komagataeibacter sp. FXV3 TaxID=2608998 RepID=UPI00187B803B|nr:hypothetical protein [Komagataeibacter sp. FXV3]